jgi:hypothetical protein
MMGEKDLENKKFIATMAATATLAIDTRVYREVLRWQLYFQKTINA